MFASLKQQFSRKLPDAKRETNRCLAWDAVLKRMPQNMSLVPLALGITKSPTYDQLQELDTQHQRYTDGT